MIKQYCIMIWIWAIFLLWFAIAPPIRIYHGVGQSMTPTIQDGARIISVTIIPKLKEGQIITFTHQDKTYCKRITSLENGIYVMGDNRENTFEGYIYKENITGIVLNYK